uniref:Uncharacterized protein n=1 Tax=Strigamia maritima TaxID=126957 RepID=T1IPW6_STRMM
MTETLKLARVMMAGEGRRLEEGYAKESECTARVHRRAPITSLGATGEGWVDSAKGGVDATVGTLSWRPPSSLQPAWETRASLGNLPCGRPVTGGRPGSECTPTTRAINRSNLERKGTHGSSEKGTAPDNAFYNRHNEALKKEKEKKTYCCC